VAEARDEQLLIVGGGIAGLSCAVALARAGFRSCVLEQAPEFKEVGAGIQMGPNMIFALGQLGLRDRVLGDAWRPQQLIMRDALDGSEITRIPVAGAFGDVFGEPYAVTHRADLQDAILEGVRACPEIELRTSACVESLGEDEGGVTATLRGGEVVRGIALIGADGIWSSVRAHVLGDGGPRVSGHIAYRAVLRRAWSRLRE
jgi:2-polyprenyl-6-methoxyphenol hydroxylase-like FAD-dependent oxidoreductase